MFSRRKKRASITAISPEIVFFFPFSYFEANRRENERKKQGVARAIINGENEENIVIRGWNDEQFVMHHLSFLRCILVFKFPFTLFEHRYGLTCELACSDERHDSENAICTVLKAVGPEGA